MATLIDSNILLDLLEPGSPWAGWSSRAMVDGRRSGPLIYNVVIASEVAYSFPSATAFFSFLSGMPIVMEAVPQSAAYQAAAAHRRYRASGGKRERTLPDFLIGAHAEVAGHALLTRDPAGYRTYFPDIEIVAPDTHP